MRYLKTYENIKNIYRKGDIVFVVNNLEPFLLPYAKIIKRYKYLPGKVPIDQYNVEILFPNTKYWAYNKEEDVHETALEDYLIIRKLSKKEIEEVKLKIAANKYNL